MCFPDEDILEALAAVALKLPTHMDTENDKVGKNNLAEFSSHRGKHRAALSCIVATSATFTISLSPVYCRVLFPTAQITRPSSNLQAD